jgi:hypothetical protein
MGAGKEVNISTLTKLSDSYLRLKKKAGGLSAGFIAFTFLALLLQLPLVH